MPHSSKKSRKAQGAPNNNNTTYIAVAVIVVIIAAAAGWYIYNSMVASASNAGSNATTSVTFQTSGNSSIVYGVIHTTYGDMQIELFKSAAPKTVANFISLAESGFYNNLVWHRIVQGFVIQTGDPNTRNGGGDRSTWGTGGSSTTVPLEIDPSLHNYVGYIGMARSSDPNSGSSQFYINLANNTSLDGQYTVFGKVISGMNVANQIANVPVNSQDQPVNPAYMTGVTIEG